MQSDGPIQLTEYQFALLERLVRLPRACRTNESPLSSSIFGLSNPSLVTPAIAIAIVLDAPYTSSAHTLEVRKGHFVEVTDYFRHLEQRIFNTREDLSNGSALERWSLVAKGLPYRIGVISSETQVEEDKAKLLIDGDRINELKYNNEILKRMHDAEICQKNAAILWTYNYYRMLSKQRDDFYIGDNISGYGPLRLLTEKMLIVAMSDIQNKSNWKEKVWNDDIVVNWKDEWLALGFFPTMISWLVDALRFKSKEIDSTTGMEMAGPPGVYLSDGLVGTELHSRLMDGVGMLLNVDDRLKDWHPGTSQTVLSLIHPSMYCLVDQRSFFANPFSDTSNEKASTLLESFLDWYDGKLDQSSMYDAKSRMLHPQSETPSLPPKYRRDIFEEVEYDAPEASHYYQWLPTDVHLDSDGNATLLSYINGLDPKANASLYKALEDLLDKFVPMWNTCLTTLVSAKRRNALHGPGDLYDMRAIVNPDKVDVSIFYDPPTCEEYVRLEREKNGVDEEVVEKDGHDNSPDIRLEMEQCFAWVKNRTFVSPEVEPFTVPEVLKEEEQYRLRNQTIQVIFKIASVELSPGKPTFDGGLWNVEGTERENIVATAIYYLDSHNITTPTLAFRQYTHTDIYLEYHPDEDERMRRLYGDLYDVSPAAQSNSVPLGRVKTPKQRAIVFPNSMQHKLSSFELIDKTKPGYRRFIVMFLIHPKERIPSTAEIVPQQLNEQNVAMALQLREDLDASELKDQTLKRLPKELSEQVMSYYLDDAMTNFDNIKHLNEVKNDYGLEASYTTVWGVDEREFIKTVPVPSEMTYEEACWHREQLIDQRRSYNKKLEEENERKEDWNMCKH